MKICTNLGIGTEIKSTWLHCWYRHGAYSSTRIDLGIWTTGELGFPEDFGDLGVGH
jgi:hypothetical protein